MLENYFLISIIMSRPGSYVRDTQAEMKFVSWPTRRQALIYTALVIGIAALVSLFTAGFDWVFSKVLNLFIV